MCLPLSNEWASSYDLCFCHSLRIELKNDGWLNVNDEMSCGPEEAALWLFLEFGNQTSYVYFSGDTAIHYLEPFQKWRSWLNPQQMEELLDEAFFIPGRRRTTRTVLGATKYQLASSLILYLWPCFSPPKLWNHLLTPSKGGRVFTALAYYDSLCLVKQ